MCKRLQICSVVIGILTVLALLVMTGGCAQSAPPSTPSATTVSKPGTPAVSSSSPAVTSSVAAPPPPSPSQPPPPAPSQTAASPKPPAPSSSAPAGGGAQPPPAGGGSQPPPAGGGAQPPPPPADSGIQATISLPPMSGKFVITSPAIKNGKIGDAYWCNGDTSGTTTAKSLPLSWTGAPTGTKSFAVLIAHIRGGGDEGIFYLVYNIPGTATGLQEGIADDTVDPKVGTLGSNDKGFTAYQAPCGGGSGSFSYTVIVYALSKTLDNLKDPKSVDATTLREAMAGSILDAGSFKFDVVIP